MKIQIIGKKVKDTEYRFTLVVNDQFDDVLIAPGSAGVVQEVATRLDKVLTKADVGSTIEIMIGDTPPGTTS